MRLVSVPHERWIDRPILPVKLKAGEKAEPREFPEYLESRIAKWWMPDAAYIVSEIPLGATGKIDKKAIRARLEELIRIV